MNDMISRQAAIDAIAKQSIFSTEEIINVCDKSVQDENGWLGGLKEAILAVLELPSVQQEPCDDPRADVYYLSEKIGIHRLYALVVELRGE